MQNDFGVQKAASDEMRRPRGERQCTQIRGRRGGGEIKNREETEREQKMNTEQIQTVLPMIVMSVHGENKQYTTTCSHSDMCVSICAHTEITP